MKIAVGTTFLAAGQRAGNVDGIGTYTRELIAAYDALGVDYLPLDLKAAMPGIQFKWRMMLSAGLGKPVSVKWPQNEPPELFHATDHMIPILADMPTVATIMDPIPLLYPEWVTQKQRQLKNWIFKKSASKAQHIITISQFSAQEVSKAFEIPLHNITAIPLAAPKAPSLTPAQIHQTLQENKLAPGFFLFIGTIQPRKNLARILEAFLRLPEKDQYRHPLVIVGRDGWRSESVIHRISEPRLEGRVIWLKHMGDDAKQALLQSALCLVFPSRYEGFGLPVLEGFAAGLPVITSNTTSLPEVAGEAALLVDPDSTDALHAAMQQMMDDEKLRRRLTALGYARLRQFSWQNTATQTLAVYRKVVER